ncbi:MAG: EVE domain-containing protein [Gammaproteobacteria bacterium]|nr:EVE domain-containing protein [Gammaproteobacteria bacterium]
MAYWLFKSEPETFGIDALAKMPKQTEHWDGVRNYQARNMLRDQIKVRDKIFFYHSNCNPPGIVGIARVVRSGYPDDSALNPESDYYDPKSTPENPRWFMVDVKFEKKFKHIITLDELKNHPELSNMAVTRQGNRLSITPVSAHEWKVILSMAK